LHSPHFEHKQQGKVFWNLWKHGPAERSNITCPSQQAVASSSTTKVVVDHEAKEKGSKATQEEMENMKEIMVSGYDDYERIGGGGEEKAKKGKKYGKII
jgi:hypothetical protein